MCPEKDGQAPRLKLVIAQGGSDRPLVDSLVADGATVLRSQDLVRDGAGPLDEVEDRMLGRLVTARLEGAKMVVFDGAFSGLTAGAASHLVEVLSTPDGMPVVYVAQSATAVLWLQRLAPDSVQVDVLRAPMALEAQPAALPPPARPADGPVRPLLPVVAVLVSVALWAATVPATQTRNMGDLGLAPVLPAASLFAIALLSVSFLSLLRRSQVSTPLAVLHVVALILMLYGVTSVVEEMPRLNVTWRHAGIAEHFMEGGEIDARIDAYFNWPGFFVATAAITELAGFAHPLDLMSWASTYFNLFFLVPVLLIVRRMTTDRRLQWLAVWLFFLANWVNQDYFSPQAVAFAGYLVILALILSWLGPETVADRRQAAAALTFLFLIFVAMVVSHQLTPFAVVGATAALVAARRCPARGLPLLLGVTVVAWVSLMTEPFLAGRIHDLVGSVGDLSQSTNANVTERLKGSPEHVFVVRVRLAMTAGLFALAGLGALRRLRHGHKDVAVVVLGLATFPLFGFQSYGGEMLLRVYLFALPFVAALGAAAFFPAAHLRQSRLAALALAMTLLVMPGAFLVSRYGNERINLFTVGESAAVDRLYEVAPPGSLLVAASGNLPWRGQSYTDYEYRTLTRIENDRGRAEPRIEDLVSVVQRRPSCSYFIITRAERAYVELLGVWPKHAVEDFEAELRGSPLFDLVFENVDGAIYRPSLRLRARSGTASRDGSGIGGVGCLD